MRIGRRHALWLKRINYAEGVFLQEYLGRREVGHIALVSGGKIYSLVTNQEYKRAFAGNMGVIAGAPLGGLVERDSEDKYGLARELLHPLLPWFRAVDFHGPIQVTAVHHKGKWHVIEYNIRIGVTSGAMILRLLANPLQTLLATGRNQKVHPRFVAGRNFGCSVTLAGYGYPYVQIQGPHLPVDVTGEFDCDVWWNEVARDGDGRLRATGHRIADVIGFGASWTRPGAGPMPTSARFAASAVITGRTSAGAFGRRGRSPLPAFPSRCPELNRCQAATLPVTSLPCFR